MCKDLTILCLSACMWPAYICQTYDALYIKHFPVSITTAFELIQMSPFTTTAIN